MLCLENGMAENVNAALIQGFFFICRTAAETGPPILPWGYTEQIPVIYMQKSFLRNFYIILLMCI